MEMPPSKLMGDLSPCPIKNEDELTTLWDRIVEWTEVDEETTKLFKEKWTPTICEMETRDEGWICFVSSEMTDGSRRSIY